MHIYSKPLNDLTFHQFDHPWSIVQITEVLLQNTANGMLIFAIYFEQCGYGGQTTSFKVTLVWKLYFCKKMNQALPNYAQKFTD